MATHGTRTTETEGTYGSVSWQARAIPSVHPDIWNPETWNNSAAAMTALITNLNKKISVPNWQFFFYEDTYVQPFAQINSTTAGALSATATGLTVDDNTMFVDHNADSNAGGATVVHNPRTGENMLVTATNYATTTGITVVRNYGDTITTGGKIIGDAGGGNSGQETYGVALLNNDYLVLGAAVYPDGSQAPAAVSTVAGRSHNYTQIMRVAYDLTMRDAETDQYGGRDLPYQRKKAGEEIKIAINRAFWFGNRRAAATDGTMTSNYITFTGGVFEHLSSNELDIAGTGYGSGTLTEKVLDEWTEMLSDNPGSGLRHVFCGTRFINAVGSLKRNITRVDDKGTSFGTIMREWTAPSGLTIRLVAEPKVFNAQWSPTTPTIAGANRGTAVALDLSLLNYCYFKSYDVKMYDNILTDNHPLRHKGEWMCDVGLMMRGYGLDHTNRATTGTQRSPHGRLVGFKTY